MLENENVIEKKFMRFVIPSMITMFLNGLYTIVDGFFVGNAVGDVGLAGIGLVFPITAVLIAIGMGIGVGGSVLMSTFRGAGEHQKANQARANTFILLLLASIVVTIVLTAFHTHMVSALGAKGKVYDAAVSYIRIIAIGGGMQIISSGLVPIIRNSHKTVQAMLIMGSGLIINIILDATFTIAIPMGLAGAALATIIAQAFTVILGIICLLREKEHKIKKCDFKWNKNMVKKTLRIAVAPFGLSLMPSLITIFNNWQCLQYGGDLAVSAYAVVNYLIASVLLLLEGIGEGIQPLISYCNGAKNYSAMRKIRNKGFITVLIFSALFLIFAIPARTILPMFFSTSAETGKIIYNALPILSIAFPMMGIGKLFVSYFYACGETVYSTLLVYLDPILFTPLCIFTLPGIFGLQGVWMSLPGAQIMIMILLTILFYAHTMKYRQEVLYG